jgi:FkbM family methyltransferase
MSKDNREAIRVGARLALDLGPSNPWQRLRLLFEPLLIDARFRRGPVQVRVRVEDREVAMAVPDFSGFLVLVEVFCQRPYDVDVAAPPARILDLGAHCGAATVLFALRYPRAEVVAVEANPLLFPLLQRNVAALPNVTCVAGAVSSSTEPVVYHEGDLSWGGYVRSSADPDPPDWVRATHTVEPVALDDLLAKPVDVVKMDIEGAEYDVLPTSERLPSVGTIVGEIHGKSGEPATDELLSRLRETHDVEITSAPEDPHLTFTAARRGARSWPRRPPIRAARTPSRRPRRGRACDG